MKIGSFYILEEPLLRGVFGSVVHESEWLVQESAQDILKALAFTISLALTPKLVKAGQEPSEKKILEKYPEVKEFLQLVKSIVSDIKDDNEFQKLLKELDKILKGIKVGKEEEKELLHFQMPPRREIDLELKAKPGRNIELSEAYNPYSFAIDFLHKLQNVFLNIAKKAKDKSLRLKLLHALSLLEKILR